MAEVVRPPRTVAIAVPAASSEHPGPTTAVEWALRNVLRSGDKVIFLHSESVKDQYYFAETIHSQHEYDKWAAYLEEQDRELKSSVAALLAPAIEECEKLSIGHELLWVKGEARDAVVDTCEQKKADILVIGNRGLGPVTRALLGSVSDYAMHHCHCAVAIIREHLQLMDDPGHRRRIAVAVEPHSNEYVVNWVTANVLRKGDHVLYLNVSHALKTQKRLNASQPADPSLQGHESKAYTEAAALLGALVEHCDHNEVTHEGVLLPGRPAEALEAACDNFKVDLLVMGSMGKGAVKRMIMGSVSTHCVHHVKCPVLVVRKPK